MAYSNSGSDTEVTSCSKECVESYSKLKKLYDEQREQLGDASIEIQAYTQALKKVEAQLVAHQKNQMWYEEKIRFMKIDLDDKSDVLSYHKKLLAEAIKEKENLKAKLKQWKSSSKNLGKLLGSQMSAYDKFRLGYGDHRFDGNLSYEKEVFQSVFNSTKSDVENKPLNDRFVKANEMHVVPPPMIYMPIRTDEEVDDSKFTYGKKQSETSETSESDTKTNEYASCDSDSSNYSPKVVNEPMPKQYESDSDNDYVPKVSLKQEKPSFADTFVKHVKNPMENVNSHSQSPKRMGLGYCSTRRACFVCGSYSHLIKDCDFHEKRMAKQSEQNKKGFKGTGLKESEPVWNNVQRINHQNKFVPKAVLTRTDKIPVNTARQIFLKQAVPRKVSTARPNVNTARRTFVSYDPHKALKNKGIIDSGCSRHMTGKQGKFEEKADEGFLVGYSLNSKAFRVYNLETKIVEENLHIRFLENKPNVAGKGPTWLFDLDYLNDSMNYQPVTAVNKANKTAGPIEANDSAGTQNDTNAGNSEMEAGPVEEHIVLPFWPSYTSTIRSLEKRNKDEKPNEDSEGAARASSTNNVNTASTTVNTASTPVNTASSSEDVRAANLSYPDPSKCNIPYFQVLGYEDWTGAVADINEDGFCVYLFSIIMPPRRFKKKSVRKIVEKRVAKAIEKYEKTRANSNNTCGSGSTNTGGTVVPEMHGCSYKTFMNGKPHSFKGTEDDKVKSAITWWNRNVQTLGLANANKIPWSKTLTLKGDDIEAYSNRFHELVLMCPELVSTESKKIEKYIRGFPERIKGNITSSKPATLHEAINMARELVEQSVQGRAARIGESNERKWEDNQRNNNNNNHNYNNNHNNNNNRNQNNNHHQQQNRRPETVRAYAAALARGKIYVGNLPKCNRATYIIMDRVLKSARDVKE
ncbi:hypothetical protein Tco_0796990 [Tanacetum coccineum]